MAGNSIILWRQEVTKHINSKRTPEAIKNGVGTGANLFEDLGELIEFCRNDGKRRRSIAMIICQESDVERNLKSPHGGYKSRHYIPLAGGYVSWQEAERKYECYLNNHNPQESY